MDFNSKILWKFKDEQDKRLVVNISLTACLKSDIDRLTNIDVINRYV